MKLTVKDVDDFEHTIHGITLDKGITPTLSILTDEELAEFHIPEIEPAVWFKILIVECATIDCVNRHVTWYSTKPVDESSTSSDSSNLLRSKKTTKRLSESTYLLCEQMQHNYMDLDEVFVETKRIVMEYLHAKENAVPNARVSFYQAMFSVLHRYVLPSIALGKEDLPSLEAAFEYLNMLIKKHDEAITVKNDAYKSVSKQQFKLREQYYVEIFAKKDGDRLNYPADIAMLLYNHIQEDLSHFSQRLTEAQTDVNLVKRSIQEQYSVESTVKDISEFQAKFLQGGVNPEGTSRVGELHGDSRNEPTKSVTSGQRGDECTHGAGAELSERETVRESDVEKLQQEVTRLRGVRDRIFQRYKTILQVREILGEYVSDRVIVQKDNKKKVTKKQIIRSKLKKLKTSKRKTKIPKYVRYIEMEEEKREKMEETSALVEEKVHMISVKEGIKCATEELKTGNVAFGVDFDAMGSLRATDVLKKRPALPQWLSLSEQIMAEVENVRSEVSRLHEESCRRVVMQCAMFQKLHKKYLLSESDSPDNLSVDSSTLGSVFNQSRLSLRSASSAAESSDGAIPMSSLRRNPKGTARSRQLYNYRESCVYREAEECGGYGLEDLVCIARPNGIERDYSYAPPKRHDSLVELDDTDEFDDIVIVHDTSPEYAQKTVDKLKQDIKRHMHQVCVLLQGRLGKESSSDYQKIWTSYERIYFVKIMYSLEQIYTLAYADVLSGLQESLPKLTPHTLAMDNQVILRLFDDLPSEGDVRVEESESRNRSLNLELDSEEIKALEQLDSVVLEEGVGDSVVPEEGAGDSVVPEEGAGDSVVLEESAGNTKHGFRPSEFSTDSGDEDPCSESSPAAIRKRFKSDSAVPSDRNRSSLVDGALCDKLEVTLEDPFADMRLTPAGDSQRSSTDLNMNLAEQMIQNTSNGQLRSELLKCTQRGKHPEARDLSDKSQNVSAHGNMSLDSGSSPSPNLEESFSSMQTSNKSKYANVLEQINMDYARQVEKHIHIYYPISVNYWHQERSTWPLLARGGHDIEFASDAMMLQNARLGIDASPFASRRTFTSRDDVSSAPQARQRQIPVNITDILHSKSVRIQAPYRHQLDGVVKHLEALCSESTPTAKLQLAFKALHELGIQVNQFHKELAGRASHFSAPSADDLTDFLVVLLCNCELTLVTSLYINVQIMRDHMAESLETGPFGFALMQLTICLHFLQERIVLQRGLMENERARLSFSL